MNTTVFYIKSFEEFKRYAELAYNDERIILFRGQKEVWPLCPRLIRVVKEKKRLDEFYDIEKRILKKFKELSCQYDIKIRDYNDWDVLALAQHFGLPTRLLDWTSNAFTALWFAFELEKDNDNERIVWGLIVDDDFPVDMEKDSPFYRRFIKVYRPKYNDTRIIAQQSWFAIWNIQIFGNGGNGLPPEPNIIEAMDELEEFEYHLAKFIIPNNLRTEILNKLEIMHINYFSLFPDLTGLCKNIEWQEFN
ncbi:MAG: FRG domain-containing protein [Prolixibacteraceae bacterium]